MKIAQFQGRKVANHFVELSNSLSGGKRQEFTKKILDKFDEKITGDEQYSDFKLSKEEVNEAFRAVEDEEEEIEEDDTVLAKLDPYQESSQPW